MAAEILTEASERVGIVRLNRPQVLNTLNAALLEQLGEALARFDADHDIRCLLLSGSEKAFAAGADIAELAEVSMVEIYLRNQAARWERIRQVQKPIVAAVSGYALGAGCELMMHCDVVIAAETARIGQPEISLGVMPGAGGTPRLPRAGGKARAMAHVLARRTAAGRAAVGGGGQLSVAPSVPWPASIGRGLWRRRRREASTEG